MYSLIAEWKFGILNLSEDLILRNTVLEEGKRVFNQEIDTLLLVKAQLGDTFAHFTDEIMQCKGKIIFIGMGKSGHVAGKIAATMSSLGTSAISLNPAECMHGDLGMIQRDDVVVLISYSGESDEIVRIIPSINKIGATLLGITGNAESTLSRACKIVQVMDGIVEACHLGLAPTSSTTAVMVYGDALSVAVSKAKGFGREDFGVFHPSGSLGKSLITRAIDLMRPIDDISFVTMGTTYLGAIEAIINTDTDMIPVVDGDSRLIGIITNGELKRTIQDKKIEIDTIDAIVRKYPIYVDISAMAIDALKIMKREKIHAMPVVKDERPVGIIEKREIIKYGIYI